MKGPGHLDRASGIVIGLTFALFAGSLLVKGLTHDLFLEAGVLLVSVKLILSSYRMDTHVRMLNDRIGEVLARLHVPARGDAPAVERQVAPRS